MSGCVESYDIILAEDDRVVREAYAELLANQGYSVRTARDGAEAVKLFSAKHSDLVVLDVMMPLMNGVSACRRIRALDRTVGVLFLTAMPSDVALVGCFAAGGDDYIDKRCSEAEFVARVQRAIERTRIAAGPDSPLKTIGRCVVDLDGLNLRTPDGVRPLTRFEAAALRLLLSAPGKVFSTDSIYSALRGADFAGDHGVVRSHIAHIRRKLGSDCNHIVALRGCGYKFEP